MAQTKHLASPKVSDSCYALTSRMQCSICDADTSSGLSDGSICLNFCDEYFLACMNDLIDPYQDPKVSNPFCTEESMVCSPAHEVASSSREFCEYMGFKVLGPDEEENIVAEGKEPYCFNGIPRQLNIKGKILRTED